MWKRYRNFILCVYLSFDLCLLCFNCLGLIRESEKVTDVTTGTGGVVVNGPRKHIFHKPRPQQHRPPQN